MIKIRDLVKEYQYFVLQIQALDLLEGNTYALVGANGAGKTTFLSCLTGQITFEGDVIYDDLPFKTKREQILSRLGYVGEKLYFYRDAPTEEYFSFIKSFYSTWNNDLFEELMLKLEIDIYRHIKIKHLSRGNALKVALLACLSCEHKWLILDEPTAGLDIATRQELYRIINEYRSKDAIVVFSTHMIEDIDNMSTHILPIKDGRLAVDTPINILSERSSIDDIRSLVLDCLNKTIA